MLRPRQVPTRAPQDRLRHQPVETINYQLRKVTKTRGHFPSDAAALKLLRLAARNISDKRGNDLGTGTWGWTQALNAFESTARPSRRPRHRTAWT